MKRTLILALFVLATCFVNSCSCSSEKVEDKIPEIATSVQSVVSEGPRCNGTVGCNCPGFAPITNGNEWEKTICRYCGHSRSSHR